MSWITSSSSGVSSVCPSFAFLFLVCLKCDDPWLSGHINKWRASLILTSTWHGCPAWVGLESLCGWMGMCGSRLPWGVVGRGRRKYKTAFPLALRVVLQSTPVWAVFQTLPYVCHRGWGSALLGPKCSQEVPVRQIMHSLESSYQGLSREQKPLSLHWRGGYQPSQIFTRKPSDDTHVMRPSTQLLPSLLINFEHAQGSLKKAHSPWFSPGFFLWLEFLVCQIPSTFHLWIPHHFWSSDGILSEFPQLGEFK